MNIRIEHGKTIISTGDAVGGIKNKHGVSGISYDENFKVYKVKIQYKKKAYHLAQFDKLEDAIPLAEEAKRHQLDDTFLEWYEADHHLHYFNKIKANALKKYKTELLERVEKGEGELIRITEWGKRNGICDKTVRDNAAHGRYITQQKIKGKWFINSLEENHLSKRWRR